MHVEETFLASDSVNYLGYTLTTNGIKPQLNKILPILRFAAPKDRRQLRAFLGFCNHYKDLWYQRSLIFHPLTQLTSTKATFLWTPVHQKAFDLIKNVMARQILLKYPDFTKPFHIYTDASQYQLGGVILQDTSPIAFYSCSLTQA